MRRYVTPRRLQFLGVVFVCVVAAVVIHTHQLIIPLFLGLLTWGKVWIKSLTPKLGLMLVKNGVAIQLRRIFMQASTHIFVKSHRPWRRLITTLKLSAVAAVKNTFTRYLQMPLWMRTAIAIAILVATAGSSFAVFALLIIPQPVLNWLRQRVTATLNKLGATKMFSAIWQYLVPEKLRHRWHMHVKWTLGRRQVIAAKQLHQTVLRTTITHKKPLTYTEVTDTSNNKIKPSARSRKQQT
ncbi:MAG: hypothetical protein AB8B97_08310 [Granulosicoccus sp.]